MESLTFSNKANKTGIRPTYKCWGPNLPKGLSFWKGTEQTWVFDPTEKIEKENHKREREDQVGKNRDPYPLGTNALRINRGYNTMVIKNYKVQELYTKLEVQQLYTELEGTKVIFKIWRYNSYI